MKGERNMTMIDRRQFVKYSAVVAGAFALGTSLTACGGGSGSSSSKGGAQTVSVCLASEPETIDPALNKTVDGGSLVNHAFVGLATYKQKADGSLELVPACATELPEGKVGSDGKVTYTYTLRDGLMWSDGSPLTAADFVYSWGRAVSPDTAADYAYMFEAVDGGAEAETGAGSLNVKAVDEKTLEVVLTNACPYWNELLAFPAYMPVKQSVVDADPTAWATDPSTYIGNGPYTLTQWEHNSKMVYVKNPNYFDADSVTMDTINFYLSDNQNNMLSNFQNGSWQYIDDVPTAEIPNLKASDPDEFFVEGQLGTYYVTANNNSNLLPSDSKLSGDEALKANEEIRNALALLIDRNYIVESITQAGQVPASSFVAMGLTDADGSTQFYENAGDPDKNKYPGYFNTDASAYEGNVKTAIDTLKKYFSYDEASKKFTNFPNAEYLYNTSDAHKAIGEYLQATFANYGINMTLTNQEWATFVNTRKNGEFTFARNGWLADYNDPISFLDLWTTQSGNNDSQLGKGENAGAKVYSLDLTKDKHGVDYKKSNASWADTYDYIIAQIKTNTDKDQRYALMHKAEDLLMSTGTIIPLYYYTDIYMCSKSLKGAYASPLGFKYFMYSTIA